MLHSLHFTTPISEVEVSGRAPNTFMSRADSHDVGGELGRGVSGMVSGEGVSNEKGGKGGGDGLSLSAMRYLWNSSVRRAPLNNTCQHFPQYRGHSSWPKRRHFDQRILQSEHVADPRVVSIGKKSDHS